MSITTIIVQKSTRERLRALGKKGDTYDNIINELMKAFQKDL